MRPTPDEFPTTPRGVLQRQPTQMNTITTRAAYYRPEVAPENHQPMYPEGARQYAHENGSNGAVNGYDRDGRVYYRPVYQQVQQQIPSIEASSSAMVFTPRQQPFESAPVNRQNTPMSLKQEHPRASEESELTATRNGMWSLLGFAAGNFYDLERGMAYDKETCEKNAEKLRKNKRPINFHEQILFAQKCRDHGNFLMEEMALQMATMAAWSNNQMNSNEKSDTIKEQAVNIIKKRGFSYDAAKEFDKTLTLPSKKSFLISEGIGKATNWTSSTYVAHVRAMVRGMLDKIEAADDYFICYTTSLNPSEYISIGEELYDDVTDYLIAGFGQKEVKDVVPFTKRLVVEAIGNKLNRVRGDYNELNGEGSSEKKAQFLATELDKEAGEFKKCSIKLPDVLKTTRKLKRQASKQTTAEKKKKKQVVQEALHQESVLQKENVRKEIRDEFTEDM